MSDLPAELAPEAITAIVDTREQHAWDLSPLQMVTAGLTTGDYSLVGFEDQVAIERKSLSDLISCCGAGRERFENELSRLRGIPSRCVIVESSWGELLNGEWRSQITPRQASGSILSWTNRYGIPFHFAGSRESAQDSARQFLYLFARSRWRELRVLSGAVRRKDGAV